jgi:hypothetical protein
MKINDQKIPTSILPVGHSRPSRTTLAATIAVLGIAAASAQMTPPTQPAPAPVVPAMPAAQTANPNEAVFKRVDSDGDGYISKVELQKADANLGKDFEKFDADKDGRLSMTEFDAMMKAMKG